MHIIVDGYNLIGGDKGLRGDLEDRRKTLLKQLEQYQQRKAYPITVVFDGWRSSWIYETEEKLGDLTIIFSRRGEKADSVIARLAQELGSAGIVVTSDRELRQAVEASGATAIYAREFEAKVRGFDPLDRADRYPSPLSSRQKKGNPSRLPKAERKRKEKLNRL